MQKYEETFKNELKNIITIEITNVEDCGIDSESNTVTFDAVSIKLTGPKSESEDVITKYEAYKMYLKLKEYFTNNNTASKVKKW